MHRYRLSEKLEGILSKLSKKDKNLYEQVLKKIDEIIKNPNVDHYKNLRYDFKDFKRVHIGGSFVLVFSFDNKNDVISFEDLDHHDNIYKH